MERDTEDKEKDKELHGSSRGGGLTVLAKSFNGKKMNQMLIKQKKSVKNLQEVHKN